MRADVILLIGDEPNILRTLRRNLTSRGYEVFLALDDQEVYDAIERTEVDLFVIILEFTTVKVDGLQVCAQIRKMQQAPIIVLSSIGSNHTKVQALDMGADDYLVMPFDMEEFLARVRSALRRWAAFKSKTAKDNKLILAGDLVIETEAREVLLRGKKVRLTPTEFDILVYLASNQGKVVTHRDILKAVWGLDHGGEREYLRVYVSQIRKKIEDDPLSPKYILTDPGIGYRFMGEA
jgi:two-component system KDP operon response regulator KdpE